MLRIVASCKKQIVNGEKRNKKNCTVPLSSQILMDCDQFYFEPKNVIHTIFPSNDWFYAEKMDFSY